MMNNFKYFGMLSVAVVALTGSGSGAFAADSTSGFGQINMTQGIVKAVKAGDSNQLKGAVGSIAKPIVTSNVAGALNGLVGGSVMNSNGTLNAKGLSSAVTGSSVVQNIGSSLGLSSQMTGTVANLGMGLALNGGDVKGIVKKSMPAIKTAAKTAVVTAGAKAINGMLGSSVIGASGTISMSGVKDALGKSGAVADLKTKAGEMFTSAKDTVSGWFTGGALESAGGGIKDTAKNMLGDYNLDGGENILDRSGAALASVNMDDFSIGDAAGGLGGSLGGSVANVSQDMGGISSALSGGGGSGGVIVTPLSGGGSLGSILSGGSGGSAGKWVMG